MAKVGQGRSWDAHALPFFRFIKNIKHEKRKKGAWTPCLVPLLLEGSMPACLASLPDCSGGTQSCEGMHCVRCTERYPGPVVGFNVGDDDWEGQWRACGSPPWC